MNVLEDSTHAAVTHIVLTALAVIFACVMRVLEAIVAVVSTTSYTIMTLNLICFSIVLRLLVHSGQRSIFQILLKFEFFVTGWILTIKITPTIVFIRLYSSVGI